VTADEPLPTVTAACTLVVVNANPEGSVITV
jgi:hypothetical protein